MPFIEESWYVASWAADLASAPVRRTIIGERVAIYRGERNQPIAIGGVCPHRFASLAIGKVHGDVLACPYHGLRFGADGQCVHNPHGPIPTLARVRSFPVVERYGLIWIWMGRQSSSPDSIPDLSALADNSWAWVHGSLHVRGHYQLVLDNLLDLTHVEYLHPFLAAGDVGTPLSYQARQEGERVLALYDRASTPSSSLVKGIWAGAPPEVRLWSHMQWDAPATLHLDSGFAPVDAGSTEALRTPSFHLLTPETATTTHYFWAVGRNMRQEEAEISAAIHTGIEATFVGEDEPMISDIQATMGARDLEQMKPLLLNIDSAAARARRVIDARLQRERAAAPAK